ncbi:MAG: hypothetical protein ACRYG5_00060 [Janthinobacterium lividum]
MNIIESIFWQMGAASKHLSRMSARRETPPGMRTYTAMQAFLAGSADIDAAVIDAYWRHHQGCDLHIATYTRLLCRTSRGSVAARVARHVRTHDAALSLNPRRPLIFTLHWVDLFFCVAGLAQAAGMRGAELLVVRRPNGMRFDSAALLALARRSHLPLRFVAPGAADTLQCIAAHLDRDWPVLVMVDLWAVYGPTLPVATAPDGARVLNLCINPFLLARRMRASIFTASALGSVAAGGLDIHIKHHLLDKPPIATLMTAVATELFGAVGPGRGLWLSWLAYPFFLIRSED